MARRTARKVFACMFAVFALAFSLTGCSVAADPAGTALEDAQDAVDGAQGALDEAIDNVNRAFQDTQDVLSGITDAPQALMDMFKGGDALFSKMASAAVYDAQSGKEIAFVDDERRIADVVARIGLVRLVSAHPDSSTAEYQISFSQNATIELGQTADEARRIETITFTTYTGSNIVEVFIPAAPENLGTYDFEVTPEFAEALRSLAQG